MKKRHLQNCKRLSFSLILIVYFSSILNAQNLPKLKDPENPLIVEHAFMLDSDGGLIYWNEGALSTNSLFTTHRNNTGLGDLDSMVEISTWRDSLLEDEDSPAPDIFHTLYQQFYNGVKVEGAEYTLHHDGEELWISSGFIAENLNLSVSPQINESTALNYALQHGGAETWLWDSLETDYPIGELIITFIADSNGNESFKLAWKFNVVALSELYNRTLYIDANTGNILKELNNIHDDGSFNHLYYGMKYDLDTRQKIGGLGKTDGIYLQMIIQEIYILLTIQIIIMAGITKQTGIGKICLLAQVMMFGVMIIGVQQLHTIVPKNLGIILSRLHLIEMA